MPQATRPIAIELPFFKLPLQHVGPWRYLHVDGECTVTMGEAGWHVTGIRVMAEHRDEPVTAGVDVDDAWLETLIADTVAERYAAQIEARFAQEECR